MYYVRTTWLSLKNTGPVKRVDTKLHVMAQMLAHHKVSINGLAGNHWQYTVYNNHTVFKRHNNAKVGMAPFFSPPIW